MTTDQYADFLSEDNFKLAYIRIKTATKSAYKEFYYDDFNYFESAFFDNISTLIDLIREDLYVPSSCEKYYMPKRKNLARPITMLSLIDQIVYQSLANIIADNLFSKLERYFNINVFGNIFTHSKAENNIFFYEKWKNQWKKFNDYKKQAFDEGYEFTAEFDIASFYDTIDHNILLSILKQYDIGDSLLNLLKKCLSAWTITAASDIPFSKNSGIPQGPVSSAFFAEIYLFKLDEEMRKQKNIRYFRYADDISIMAQTESTCRRMIVMLDLLARDISLIPQAEKIDVSHIDNINKHINQVSVKFSKIAEEYIRNNRILKEATHNRLKTQFLQCFDEGKFDKTVVRFALYKLNKDDEIRDMIIENIMQLELFYDGIIYYFNRHYPNDNQFNEYIIGYLMSDTILFQYNKALLFKSYEYLDFDEGIFNENYVENKRFWIVQYQLINWLKRCDKIELAEISCVSTNYYTRRRINEIQFSRLKDDKAKKVFLGKLIANEDPMLSLQGIYLWRKNIWLSEPSTPVNNPFSMRIWNDEKSDYLSAQFKKIYALKIPKKVMTLFSQEEDKYKELKSDLNDFLNYSEVDASKSMMALDLFHNVIYDIIAIKEGFSTESDFGVGIEQMKSVFPLASRVFVLIHQTRNERTYAHYKDKKGKHRKRITLSELKELLIEVNLKEAYEEIFKHYSK
jgi:hypothetical protein